MFPRSLMVICLEMDKVLYQFARRRITRYCNLHQNDCENLKYMSVEKLVCCYVILNACLMQMCACKVGGMQFWELLANYIGRTHTHTHTHTYTHMTPYWDFIGFPCPTSNLHVIDQWCPTMHHNCHKSTNCTDKAFCVVVMAADWT
jgi:ABC-type enterochelin transport system permease subunit